MTLPSLGQITLADVNVELGRSSTAQISLNDADVRTLAGIPSGTISMNDLRGKSLSFQLSLLAVGGGGGGGSGAGDVSGIGGTNNSPGGGGGAAYPVSLANYTIFRGETLTITVGAGGSGAIYYAYFQPVGGTGGTSSIYKGATNLITSTGGLGGVSGGWPDPGTGGAAGSYSGITGYTYTYAYNGEDAQVEYPIPGYRKGGNGGANSITYGGPTYLLSGTFTAISGGGGAGYFGGGVGNFDNYLAGGGNGGNGGVTLTYAGTYIPSSTTGSPSISISGGYTTYTWTSSGSITF